MGNKVKIRKNNYLFTSYLLIYFAAVNPSIPKLIAILLFSLLLLLSLFRFEYLFFLLAVSNSLPFIGIFTPMFLISTVFMLILLIHYLKGHNIIYNNYLLLLVFLSFWIFLCSVVQNFDFTFFSPFLTGMIILFFVYESCISKIIELRRAITLFYFGLFAATLIGVFMTNNVFGFYSANEYRLSLVGRGDPNSYAMLLVFTLGVSGYFSLLAFLMGKFSVIDLIFLLVSILCFQLILLTASRASFFISILTVIIINLAAISSMSKAVKARRIIMLILILIIFITFSILLRESILLYFYKTFPTISSRLRETPSNAIFKNDVRFLLIKNAVLEFSTNPIFGIGINKFLQSNKLLTHNTAMDFLISGGLIGFLLYYSQLLILFINLFRYKIFKNPFYFSVYIGYFLILLNSLTISSIGDKLLWIPLGLILVINSLNKKSETVYE